MKSRVRQWLFLALVVTALGGPAPAMLAWASTMPGAPIQIGGLDDLAATTDAQMRGGSGRMLSYLLMGGGALSLMTGYVVPTVLMGGGGLGMAFVPRIATSVFDAAPAATDLASLLAPTLTPVWWAPFAPVLYPFLMALKGLRDPMMVLALAASLLLAHAWQQRHGIGRS